MLVNETTFEATTTEADGTEVGTVEVTLRRDTRRVEAVRMPGEGGTLIVRGLTGRYEFGGKAWPATIMVRTIGNGSRMESAWFGRDDRSGRFNKANGLYFA